MSDTFQVPNLVRGLQVIEYLTAQEQSQSITEIANALGFPKNSLMRVVNALEYYGYVQRDSETKTWRMTRKLFSMAYRMPHEKMLVEGSLEAMKSLRDQFKETVVLSVLEGNRGIILEQAQGLHPFRFVCEPGTEQQLHTSASTKAMLACLSASALEGMLSSHKFERYTEATITSRKAFMKELKEVRACGYALDRCEQLDGVNCVAASVRDHLGYPVAAMTITGPSNRFNLEGEAEAIGRSVCEHAASISRYLGYDAEAKPMLVSA